MTQNELLPISKLTFGDRFFFNHQLWTLIDVDDGYYIARRHDHSAPGSLDQICSFDPDEFVNYCPPQELCNE